MVLGYGGFLHLKEQEYLLKLQNAPLEDLREQELVKMRRQAGSCYSMACGVSSAPVTAGTSLVFTGIGGRKLNVANRKLRMIQDELARRGQAPHQRDWKDIAIPIAAAGVGSAVTSAIGAGFSSAVPVENVAPTGGSTTTTIATEAVHQVPSAVGTAVTNAVGAGFSSAAPVESMAPTGGSATITIATEAAYQVPSADGMGTEALTTQAVDVTTVPAEGVGSGGGTVATEAVYQAPSAGGTGVDTDATNITQVTVPADGGAVGGEAAGQAAVESGPKYGEVAGDIIGGHTVDPIIERLFEGLSSAAAYEAISSFLGCRRYFGSTADLACNHCHEEIASGIHWHCCQCTGDNYDICNRCYQEGIRCPCKTGLRWMQFSWNGPTYHPNRHAVSKRRKGYKFINCDKCSETITQNRYFECADCDRGSGFDLCLNCYSKGAYCRNPHDHALYSFTWAYSPNPLSEHAYRSSGGCSCSRCGKNVFQGVFYHCNQCSSPSEPNKPGTFDLCSACYETSGGCADSMHVLRRYNAFARSARVRRAQDGGFDGYCDVAGCNKPFDGEKVWYQCASCKVGGGDFAVCELCYASGAGCADKGHHMTRVLRAD